MTLDAFPHCIPDARQSLEVAMNGRHVAFHKWQACEKWHGQISIPAEIVKIGWNEMSFVYGYASRPAEVTGGENPDMRNLSLGFSRLELSRTTP